MMTLGAQSVTAGMTRDAGKAKEIRRTLVPDCAVFINLEKEITKGSPFPPQECYNLSACSAACLSGKPLPTWHNTRGNALASAESHLCQLRDCHDPGSARVLHGHLERGEHLDAA